MWQLGSALRGSGLQNPEPEPQQWLQAGLGLAQAQAMAYRVYRQEWGGGEVSLGRESSEQW